MKPILLRIGSRLAGWFEHDDEPADAVALHPSFAEWIVMVGGAL